MSDDIRKRLGRIDFLPVLPCIVEELKGTMENPASSASDLVRHMDPSLAAEVLKGANTAYVGRKNFRHIGNIEQAVAAIGHSGLSALLLRPSLPAMADEEAACFDPVGFGRHSLFCAVLARTVSSVFCLGDPAAAYTGGLMHDIGIVVMQRFFGDGWQEVHILTGQKRVTRLEAETEVFGMDHATIGSMLLASWDVPETITESARLHHVRQSMGRREEAYAVWLANNLVRRIDADRDLVNFEIFFRRQRELLESEMAGQYLLKDDVELFETAYGQLKEVDGFLRVSLGGETW
jgi:HD-like signal output (HDOD) protein